MTIQDLNYLKENSEEDFEKFHFNIKNEMNGKLILNDSIYNMLSSDYSINNYGILYNVFTIHILTVYSSTLLNPLILNIYANDIKMDSIMINNSGLIYNTTGLQYEKIVKPVLSKVSELSYKITTLNGSESDFELNITCIIRFYKPTKEFNNIYNELNPQYDPNILPLESESESESD